MCSFNFLFRTRPINRPLNLTACSVSLSDISVSPYALADVKTFFSLVPLAGGLQTLVDPPEKNNVK